MTYSLTWLSQVLRDAGLNVTEQSGWQTRGHGDVGIIKAVLCHHTAGGLKDNAPSLGIVTNGRPDLAGPLAQLVLGRDGTFFIVAAGKCWHAGDGTWQGVTDGNAHMIGIEAENTGLPNDSPWPAVQIDAYAKGVAALLKHIGAPPIMCAGHKEYCRPHGRKMDPSFDMDEFRKTVATFMEAPGPVDKTYTVAKGDTLTAIAKKFGTTVSVLAGLNSLTKPNSISIGQVLKLPA